MKLSFKHKHTIRLAVLLLVLGGIITFIYFELMEEHRIYKNMSKETSSNN